MIFIVVLLPPGDPGAERILWPLLGWLVLAVILLISAWIHPERSPMRIVLGILVDALLATAGLIVSGSGGAIIVGVFLWLIVGICARFGSKYMYFAQCLFLVCFAVVVYEVPWWHDEPMVAIGWAMTIILLPIYVSALFENAKRRVEQTGLEAKTDRESAVVR